MHRYSDTFFDYIEGGSIASARVIAGLLMPQLQPRSVLDVGCGRGAWLREWKARGVSEAHGVDGDYVRRDGLLIEESEFSAVDLTAGFDLGRRYDLVASLEVAEHLSPGASTGFVRSLVAHGDVILFSAATVSQGGENHVNERPLSFWQGLFAEYGFSAFDYLRPLLASEMHVEPWYRYNSIIYANAAGADRLSLAVRRSVIRRGVPLDDGGNLAWRARKAAVRLMPRALVTRIAQRNAARLARRSSRDHA